VQVGICVDQRGGGGGSAGFLDLASGQPLAHQHHHHHAVLSPVHHQQQQQDSTTTTTIYTLPPGHQFSPHVQLAGADGNLLYALPGQLQGGPVQIATLQVGATSGSKQVGNQYW
jgi:hypothetical protein